jgi:hypothetical protein
MWNWSITLARGLTRMLGADALFQRARLDSLILEP